MKSHLLKLVAVSTAFSLLACSDEGKSPTSTDAGTDVRGADEAHTADDVNGSGDGPSGDENAKPDVNEIDVHQDVMVADRASDVSDVLTADHVETNDAPLDRGAPTRPDGGPFSCDIVWTGQGLSFSATDPAGELHSCSSIPSDSGTGRAVHRTFSGVLKSVTSNSADKYVVTIDTCAGDACAASNLVLDISSTTPVTLPVGAFVEADYFIEQSHRCSYFVRFSNLPEFDGRPNPISDKSKIYFIGSDGFFDSNTQMAPTGVAVSLLRLGCPQEGGFGGGTQAPADTYVYQFAHNGNDLILSMSESATFNVSGQSVLVKNLRSYQSTGTDDYWNWAYTFVGQ